MAMREALKNIICPSCRDPLLPNDNDKQYGLFKLKNENMRLRQQASHAYQVSFPLYTYLINIGVILSKMT